MISEMDFQAQVISMLSQAKVAKAAMIDQLKDFAMADGVSNIGVSV
jgi:uncharacterized protein YjaG (DUF416 family)